MKVRHSRKTSIRHSTLNYELPFFLLLSYSLHASTRGIHEAFISILSNNGLAAFFRNIRQVSLAYLHNYIRTNNVISALINTINEIGDKSFSDLLRYYVFSYLTSGEVIKALEYVTKRSMEELRRDISAKIRYITVIIELIMIIPIISIIFYIYDEKLFFLSLILSMILFIPIMLIHIPLIPLMIVKIEKDDIIIHVSLLFLVIVSMYVVIFIKNSYLAMLFSLLPPIAQLIIIKRHLAMIREFYSKINSLKYVLRVAEISNTNNITSIMAMVSSEEKIDYEIKYLLITGKDIKGGSMASLVSIIIVNILLNAIRTGSNIRKVAFILTEFLDSLGSIVKDILEKSFYYNFVMLFALALYAYSILYMGSVISGDTGTGMAYSLVVLSPLVESKELILLFIALNFLAAVIAISKVLRGSIILSYEQSFIPLILYFVGMLF